MILYSITHYSITVVLLVQRYEIITDSSVSWFQYLVAAPPPVLEKAPGLTDNTLT